MTARDDILNKLRSRGRVPETPPPVWQSRRRFESLAARFAESLPKVKGEVIRVESPDGALETLDTLFNDLGAQRIVANGDLPTLDWAARWPDREWHLVGQSDGDLRAFCAAADVGLSGAEAALAETGSIVVAAGPTKSRLATLLPPVHIALVPESILMPDIFTWTAARRNETPANIAIISGPSKTGDIEQVLAVGVHGPRRFIVILYGE
ncbi:MAG: lactate utilization protein [Anaerolineae bacterium]|nr:lactate utilization protein [Anaerolineae bacterium]